MMYYDATTINITHDITTSDYRQCNKQQIQLPIYFQQNFGEKCEKKAHTKIDVK